MDETMEEASSGPLTVRDVAELLHGRYAIITGGRTADNFPIITFPDLGTFCSLSDEDYKKLMLYLTSVPTMHEADLGFVLVVDRRNDKWSAVKTVLLKISGFFPGLIQEVFVLRPLGFFQKAISEVSNKFFKEEFKFKLVVCSNVEELHEHIEPTQLTPDLGGTVAYCHEDWIEQRVAVEKFSTNLQEISTALREMTRRLQETELPNDVDSTRCLLEDQGGEYRELKDDIRSAARHGETLLSCIRQPAAISSPLDLCPDRLINVSAVERLLVQLEETEKGFDYFWSDHEKRLSQCLELRKFEFDFKEHQANIASSLKELRKISEAGDSVAQVDCLLTQMHRFKLIIEDELARAETTCTTGKDLIAKNHYAVDSISPKCVELEELIAEMKVEVARKIDILSKYRDLQQRIEKANRWCAKGVDVLASQQIEKCTSSEFSEVALKELDEFLDSSKDFRLSDPREFHAIFKDVSMTPETRALVQQVLKRVEDVQMMCEQRRSSLQKLIAKPIRPIQAVVPEPAVPLLLSAPNGSGPNASSGGATTNSSSVGATTLPRSGKSPDAEKKQLIRKAKTVPKMQIEVCLGRDQPNCLPVMVNGDCQGGGGLTVPNHQAYGESTSPRTGQELQDKRGHVMAELIETEQAYVSELRSLLTGYRKELENPSMRELIPSMLLGKGDILFGNMEDIQQFHEKVFLTDLQSCSHTPEMVGRCFVQRSDVFHKLYSTYCMNKPKSEALRRQCADDNPFFKECQRKLGHKLPLGAYLLKPVQRITKYQLLLKDLSKYSDGLAQAELQEAVDTMLDVLKYVNDSMHQIAITGFHGSLADYGKLLLQGAFSVWMERKKDRIRDLKFKPSQRYIFLYEQLVLFTKKGGRDDSPSYAFKNALKTSQIGLTENVRGSRGDRRKFEVWLHGRTQVFIIQASSNQVKDVWIGEIKKVLLQQFERMKDVSTKQYSDKPQKLAPVNGTNPHLPAVIKKTRNAIGSLSWDNCPTATNNNNRVVHHRPPELGRRATLPAFRTYRRKEDVDGCGACAENIEDGWSTDEFSNSDEDDDRDVFIEQIEIGGRFSVLGDYEAVDVGEASLHEGQTVEVQKVGGAGWWYVRVVETGSQGWAPASYLGPAPNKRGSNTPSVSSQDSASGSLRHAASRSSVASNISNTSLEGGHQAGAGSA